MPLPKTLEGRLRLPVVAAPMFLASGPDLVIACCKAGVLGSFPALNQRTTEGFEEWLNTIEAALGPDDAPFAVNLIVHRTNPRLKADLEVVVKHRVPVVITSLGAAAEVVDAVHSYGGVVFHDVTTVRHAQKAAEAGVDGLILVCAGAGGHAGTLSPFALLPEVRTVFDGTILLAGSISRGEQVAAAQMMGADIAYLGTRFIATEECMAQPAYKDMLLQARAGDIVYTPSISGVPANFMRQSLIAAGLDPDNLPHSEGFHAKELDGEAKAWRDVWSAGQGVGSIAAVVPVAELVADLERGWRGALDRAEALRAASREPAA